MFATVLSNRHLIKQIKLLLLGAGESGKSTIFKQMRVLYGAPLTDAEKQEFTPVVYSNTIMSMKSLCAQAVTMENDKDILLENADNITMVNEASDNGVIDATLGNAIKALWADPGIVATWTRRAEFQIVESHKVRSVAEAKRYPPLCEA